jgi:hypothetical protein
MANSRRSDISNGSLALASCDLMSVQIFAANCGGACISNHSTTTLHKLHNVLKTRNSLGKHIKYRVLFSKANHGVVRLSEQ